MSLQQSIARVVTKATSGKWILTVTCAFVFAWKSVDGTIPDTAVVAIVSSVFTHYFTKQLYEKPTPTV